MDSLNHLPMAAAALATGLSSLELLLCTPHSIVVRARAEFDDGSASQEAGLVIARRGCPDGRPTPDKLLAAATLCAQRLGRCGSAVRRLCRLLVRVDGRWVPVLECAPHPSAAPSRS